MRKESQMLWAQALDKKSNEIGLKDALKDVVKVV